MSDRATTNEPDRPQDPAGDPGRTGGPGLAGTGPRPESSRTPGPTGGIQPGSKTRPALDLTAPRMGWMQRRREKMVAEIQRNRRGEYTIPTWVLVGALVVIVAAWAILIIF